MTAVTPAATQTIIRPDGRTAAELRIGLVGAGRMARQHATAIARLNGLARLVAVADPDPPAREALLGQAPDAETFDSLPDLLRSVAVDVVHVCTPPETHLPLAESALKAGCHIYVEKPFAETAQDAVHLLSTARAAGLQVCAGHQLLFERPAVRAAELLRAVGQVVHIESYFAFRTVRGGLGGQTPVRADRQLLDILPHPVYLLLRFLDLAQPGAPELCQVEVSTGGTVHALLRRPSVSGSLVVTLRGRPVESYLRIVGTNGVIHADFVRGTVQRIFGPGISTVDKLINPYRWSWQLAWGTTTALARRFFHRQRSYPGLLELFEAFYRSVLAESAPPLGSAEIVETVRVCEAVGLQIDREFGARRTVPPPASAKTVTVTGGTGFLGDAVVHRLLNDGRNVTVVSRRGPAPWDRVASVGYREADLSCPIDPEILGGADLLIHAAAETAGGWEAHQRNSIKATEHVLRAAAAAGIRKVIHVSSLAVLGPPRSGPLSESTDLEKESRESGPYVWGKLESERLAIQLGAELGLTVRIVRPGAVIDYERLDPPGRLGRRIGPFFVAFGSPTDRLGVVTLRFAASVIAYMVSEFDRAPAVLNLLEPELPPKRELVRRLKQDNPGLRVLWVPAFALAPLSWAATLAQAVIRPGQPRINLHKVFAVHPYDTALIRAWAGHLAQQAPGLPRQPERPTAVRPPAA